MQLRGLFKEAKRKSDVKDCTQYIAEVNSIIYHRNDDIGVCLSLLGIIYNDIR